MDGNDIPHVCYKGSGLWYAHYNGTDWVKTNIDANCDPYGLSMEIDDLGHPHISYSDRNTYKLKYASFNGRDWVVNTPNLSGHAFSGTSISLDSQGHPHIAYVSHDPDEIWYAYNNGNNWDEALVDFGQSNVVVSLDLDNNDVPYVAYKMPDGLKYGRYYGGRWSNETVDATPGAGSSNSLFIDRNNQPHISYQNWDSKNLIHAIIINDEDDERPCSSFGALSSYWRTEAPIAAQATAFDVLNNVSDVSLWYRFSLDNESWSEWIFQGKDTASPWDFDFHPLNGSGHYEFLSVANDTVGNIEHMRKAGDAICGYDVVPPVARAGEDSTISIGEMVYLQGDSSTDNIEILRYRWTFMYDGIEQVLEGECPTFTFEYMGIYPVTLTVYDSAGNFDLDTIQITVKDMVKPVAIAGDDMEVDQHQLVTFDSSASSDNIGIVNRTWTFMDGSMQVLNGVNPMYVFHAAGIYSVMLNVSDAVENWATDVIVITVNDITPPLAEAGDDIIVDISDSVTFDGGGSTDNVDIASYVWTLIYDRLEWTFVGIIHNFTFFIPGNYIVTLNVTDGAGNWATDRLSVTVLDSISPIANAGTDMTIPQGTKAVLNGSASTDNMEITHYAWSFDYLGVSIELLGMVVNYSFDTPGLFNISLTVFDEAGNFDSNRLLLRVLDKSPPKACIAIDGRVLEYGSTYEINSSANIVLQGGKSTDNVRITNYTWIIENTNGSRTLYGERIDLSFTDVGIYKITMRVFDSQGNFDNHTIHIIRNTTEIEGVDDDSAGEKPEEKNEESSSLMIIVLLCIVLFIVIVMISLFLVKRKKDFGTRTKGDTRMKVDTPTSGSLPEPERRESVLTNFQGSANGEFGTEDVNPVSHSDIDWWQ